MGNTTQCGFLSNIDQQYQYVGEQNHFLYGQIKHFKNEKYDNQHFAIKKIKFISQNKFKQYQQFINFYQQICSNLKLIRASQYIDQNVKKSKQKQLKQQQNEVNNNLNEKQNSSSSKPIFHCNKQNFIFKSATQQLSCSQPTTLSLMVNLQYLQQKLTLKSIINEKSKHVIKALENNKINQNIMLELQNKVKLCQYSKIDKLPHKQRSIINMFFNQIQVLRMFDYIVTSVYGLKVNGYQTNSVRPQLFFKSNLSQEISYFWPNLLNLNDMSNFQKSYDTLKKWLIQQNAKFHHNWSIKQRQLVFYIHPDYLQRLTQMLLNQGEDNFNINNSLSKQNLQKQNIFALGLMILQICLLQPQICSKIYHVSTCRQQQKHGVNTKKEMKYSFNKQNLTIKLNNSVLQKYLIRMKTSYSQQFTSLIQQMIFGTSLNNTLKFSKVTNQQYLTYEMVIKRLFALTEQNTDNLKSVYNSSHKSKSKSKHTTQKNSRNPSLSRQPSASGVSNPSLSSSSSISMLPVQSQQKMLSIQLLKKNCKKLQNRVQKVLIKSQYQTLKGSFVQREGRLQQLILKDQQRILSQLNRITNDKNISQKQTRFSYRKNEQQNNKNKVCQQSFTNGISLQQYGNYKLNMPTSIIIKNQSQDKQKRMNSTTKTKKILLQRVRQQQSLGNSVCQTVLLNKTKDQIQQFNYSINNETINNISNNNSISNKNQLKNTQITDKQISLFQQDSNIQFSSKSQLRNLISLKNKHSSTIKQHANIHLNYQNQNNLKQLKSKELYQLYMKQYTNLINSQKHITTLN